MGVGNLEIFENALNGTVLTERAVKRVESHVRLQLAEYRCNIAVDVDARDAIALLLEGIRAGLAGRKADGPLGRKAAHEYGNMLFRHSTGHPLSDNLPGVPSG